MTISITFDFDDAWAARLAPMVNKWADDSKDNEIIVDLLATVGATIDQLTVKQKYKLMVLMQNLSDLAAYEGSAAAQAARQSIISDIINNFPLEVGDA
jgi:hypothetical protein